MNTSSTPGVCSAIQSIQKDLKDFELLAWVPHLDKVRYGSFEPNAQYPRRLAKGYSFNFTCRPDDQSSDGKAKSRQSIRRLGSSTFCNLQDETSFSLIRGGLKEKLKHYLSYGRYAGEFRFSLLADNEDNKDILKGTLLITQLRKNNLFSQKEGDLKNIEQEKEIISLMHQSDGLDEIVKTNFRTGKDFKENDKPLENLKGNYEGLKTAFKEINNQDKQGETSTHTVNIKEVKKIA